MEASVLILNLLTFSLSRSIGVGAFSIIDNAT